MSNTKFKKYNVYFSQINQAVITVKAQNKKEAIQIAEELWQQTIAIPEVLEVETQSSNAKTER